MSKKETKETELPPQSSWMDEGFDDSDFANQGELASPYFNRLGKFIRASTDEFEVVDVASNETIHKTKSLSVVVCYHHSSAKLFAGLLTKTAEGKDFDSWSESEREVLAICYDMPQRSNYPAMFQAYPEALKAKGVVKYRTWLWCYVPAIQDYAVLTLGPSCLGSFAAWANVQKLKRRPNSATITTIELVKDKTDKGKVFYRPTFHATDTPSAASRDEWIAKFKDFADIAAAEHVEALKRTHREAMGKLQNGFAAPVALLGQANAAPQLTGPDPFAEEAPPV